MRRSWAGLPWEAMYDQSTRGYVLHFVGHGDFDPDRDEGVLALTGEDGRADLVEASRFADLLRQARPMPRLAVLNSCSSAATGSGDLFSGTAAALARSGVAAVAAMQFAISDPAAIAFARGFYAALAHGRGVDEAVSAGRIAILGSSRQTLEWITPVLYLRGDDTRLFTISSATTSSPAPRPAPATGSALRGTPPTRVPSRLARTLTGHEGHVASVTFSPDGALLATASGDRTARIWDTATGTIIRTLTGHTSSVTEVAFSPDGTLLATTSGNWAARIGDAASGRTARIWDAASGALIRTFTGHTGDVYGVAFSPDGTLLATSSADKTARIWA